MARKKSLLRLLAVLSSILLGTIALPARGVAVDAPHVVGSVGAEKIFSMVAWGKDANGNTAQYVAVAWVSGDSSEAWLAQYGGVMSDPAFVGLLNIEATQSFTLDVDPNLDDAHFEATFPTLGTFKADLYHWSGYPFYRTEGHGESSHNVRIEALQSTIARSDLMNHSATLNEKPLFDYWRIYGQNATLASVFGEAKF